MAICTLALLPSLIAQQESNPPPSASGEDPTIVLSAFEVNTSKDKGYRASNSVSGSRFDTAIKDLPFALQAFTGEFIADIKPTNIQEIALYSPGVTFRSADFSLGSVNIAIRGYEASVILRDGFAGPRVLDFVNVARMEIVKGPASFLYGQVAPGGMVNIITKSPTERFQGSASASYGSYDQYRAELDLSGPIKTGSLYYRFATSYYHDMEYWDAYSSDQVAYAPQFLWKLNDNATIALKYEKLQRREDAQLMQYPGYGSYSGLVPTASDPNLQGTYPTILGRKWNSMSDSDFRDSDSENLSMFFDVKAGEAWNVRLAFTRATDTVDAQFTGNLGLANNTFFQGRRVRYWLTDVQSDQFEAQAVGKYNIGDVSLKLLFGTQYNPREAYSADGQMPNNPAYGPVGSPLPNWDLRDPSTWDRSMPASFTRDAMIANSNITLAKSTDDAVYGGVTAGFFQDRLLLLGGLRSTVAETQTTTILSRNTTGSVTAQNVASPVFKDRKVTPQLGALFKVTNEISTFASYSESFVPQPRTLSGYRKDTPAWTSFVKGPASPTKGEGFEVGLKNSLFNGRVSSTVSYFRTENSNIINDVAELNPNTGTQFFENIQSGKQRSEGVELDLNWSPVDQLQIYASASFQEAEIVYFISSERDAYYKSVTNPSALNAADQANYKNVARFSGAPLQMSAPRQYNLWARYDFDAALKGFHIAGGANRVEDQTLLPDTPEWAWQSYTLWNALIGYSTKIGGRAVTFELNGKNLTDELYRPSQNSRARPRELLLSVSTKF